MLSLKVEGTWRLLDIELSFSPLQDVTRRIQAVVLPQDHARLLVIALTISHGGNATCTVLPHEHASLWRTVNIQVQSIFRR